MTVQVLLISKGPGSDAYLGSCRDESCHDRGRVVGICRRCELEGIERAQPERDVLSGKVIYSTICIRCHGVEGKGDGQMKFTPPVADLTSPAVQQRQIFDRFGAQRVVG